SECIFNKSVDAKFRRFSIEPEFDNYRLHVKDYDDNSTTGHLAKKAKAPWLYSCNRFLILTGQYGESKKQHHIRNICQVIYSLGFKSLYQVCRHDDPS
ncbi:hypothetical protein LSH36_1800g00000, partial [Paralvinella palmiformis]